MGPGRGLWVRGEVVIAGGLISHGIILTPARNDRHIPTRKRAGTPGPSMGQCPMPPHSVTVCAMTYGYGDESPRGRSTHRSDESDETYQATPEQYGDRRYAQHNYESSSPSASSGGAYPTSGYPQSSGHPGDYRHTQADAYGQRSGQYPAGQFAASPAPAHPSEGPYPPQPAGPYPPQPAYGAPTRSDYPTQGGYGGRGATAYQPQTYQPQAYGGRGGAPEQTGYQQPYQPRTYQPQGSETGSFRPGPYQTGQTQSPIRSDRGYPAPAQRVDDSGYPPRQQFRDPYADPYADPYSEVDLNQPEPPARRSRRGLIATLVVIVLLVAGGFGLKLYLDSGDGNNSSATTQVNKPTEDQAKRVESQKVDKTPLTADEVFGATTIGSNAEGGGSYRVVKSQAATDCKSAVGGDVATALTTAGCTQVVRATMTSPDGNYVITAGIFNLGDSTKAGAAQTAIRTAIDAHKGRFSGFAAGGGTDVVSQAAANIAWDTRGHYLMYCVIVLANGKSIASDDKRTPVIVGDVLETYLGGTVIHARETAGASPAAS
jgi:hypothetical protein